MRRPSGDTRGSGSLRSRLSSSRAGGWPAWLPGAARRARGAGRASRGEHLRVEAAPDPAAVGESRLVIRRESLDRPARLILVGKQAGSPAEHLLQRAPDPLRAVEVKDMRELVRG